MTKIQIIGENGGFLDLKEGTACPITYSIADIKDPSKKKGAFSKTITLTGSKNNNKLLGNVFDINLDVRSFDINKIINCNILVNNIPVLENGIMQLVSINKKQKNGKYDDEITYSVLVKDNVSDFFTQINNKELSDLSGFGWMNHVYTADVVKSTFNNTIKDGYKYIMPFTSEGQTATTYDDASLDLTEFSPGIYAKIYFDKIFQNAGYSYSWPTMDDTNINFSKLIIPFNGEKPVVNAVEVIDYTSEVKNSAPQTISTRTQIVNNIAGSSRYEITQSTYDRVDMPVEISDPTNRWNLLASRYNPPNLPSNQNSIQIEYEVDWELILNSFGTAYLKNYNTSSSFKFNVIPTIKMRRVGTAQYLASNNIVDIDGNFFKFNDGMYISNGVSVLKSGTSTFTQLAQGIDPAYNIEVCCGISTYSGWMFKGTNNIAGTNRTSTSFGLRITDIRVKIKTMVEGTYGYNIPVDMIRYVPQKVKQSDFIKSIFTMFNLYAEVDKDNPKRINLISRDKYYDDGKINDWSRKLEKSEAQDIRFIPEISSKSIILTYKEDSDISNKIYKEATGEVYGQQKFTFDNEFIKEEKKQEITFSPTPIFNTKFGAVCPMWLGGAPKCNLRILYDGGELVCGPYSIINYRLNSGASFGASASSYPYVGHWDKPVNPTFDLNFGVCDYYFRTDNFGSLTNNNLFNLHWRRTLNQINTGKIMTASFNLTETDILNVKLNDKIRIDNSWWNINKIQDFDANNKKPTKVELISIDDNLFIPFQKKRKVKCIVDLSTDLVAIPIRTLTKERDKFLTVNLSPYDIEVRGKYNYILEDVTSATVVGNGNLISANSQVYGNDNIIAAESTVTGNSNIVTEEGGGSIINGNEVVVTVPIDLTNYVTLTGDQNISGVKTFDAIDLVAADTFQLRGGDGRFTININENPFFEVSSGDGYMFWMNSSGYRALFDNNPLTSDRFYSLPNASGTLVLTGDLVNYVTLNTTQTITGKKTFNDVNLIKKISTSIYPTQTGGTFFIGQISGSYDVFEFYSLDGTDQDGFGKSQIYSNPEEGNYIDHTSLDNQQSSILRINYGDTHLKHIFGGQQTSIYVNGQTDKITIEGTQNKFANLGTSLITGSKTFEFPNNSGTIALLSDIPSLNLQQVTSNGATTSNFATFSGGVNLSYNTNYINVNSDISIGVNTVDGTSNIISNGGNIELSVLTNGMFPDVGYIDITPYTFSINTNSSGTAKIDTNSLTTNRSFSFPNESGTLSLLSDVFATQTTGTTISFNKPKVFNLPATPATSSITNDLTGAKIGVVQKLYHQFGTAPTFPVGWVKVGGTYSTSQLNIIYSEYVTGTRVEYWIINI